MTGSHNKDSNTSETPAKQEWQTPVLMSLDTEETAGPFAGGVEADLGGATS